MSMSPKQYKSTCSYCGVGCGVTVSLDRRGKLSLKGDKDSPVNAGMLCSKGRHLHSVVMDQSDRLLHPKVRYSRAHPLQSVSWDIALDRVSQVFKAIIKEHGPNSVGLYVSGQMLTEEYYVANKLMKGFIGSNNIDTNSRLCMSSAVVGYKKAFGDDLVPTAYEDIDVSGCFFIAGANPAWCHPIVYRRME
ncbi:MAG: molybdopterin-dependent oxidoreductase, partial [Candidatus Hydrogenedentota bacterium]